MFLADINDWLILTGRIHPLVVHLPIGILLLAALFECLTVFKRYDNLKNALPLIWLCGAISASFASIAGYLLAQSGGYEEDLLIKHQWLGITVAVLSIIGYILKRLYHKKILLQTGFAITSVVLLSFTGHYGGALTHGEEFLNEPLQAALGIEGNEDIINQKRKVITNIEEAVAYHDLIQPVLEQKCYRCHNEKKQKGKLRVDTYDHMIKGGESGTALVAGKPAESELYKRLILPEEDEDRMPPKGKTQLTPQEIALIHWWIQEGEAAADRKVGQIVKPEPIKVMLAEYTTPSNVIAEEVENEIPDVKLSEVTEQVIQPIVDIGLVVNKLATAYPFLTVNCINAENFSDSQAKLLLPTKDHIVWLKAGNTQLTDAGMVIVGQLINLTRLSLEHTSITDKGLGEIKNLRHLQYLNLVGTKISDESISSLSHCKKIKAVYLWQTSFTPAGIERLKKILPKAEINAGESF